jgi:hypothetical protein
MTIPWTHYPENDELPEHYSSPFGLVIRRDDGRWEGWTLTSIDSPITHANELCLNQRITVSASARYLKSKIDLLASEAVTRLTNMRARAAQA